MTYKDLHPSDGTTAFEVFLVFLSAYLTTCIATLVNSIVKKHYSCSKVLNFSIDFIVIIFFNILIFTVLADYFYNVVIALIVILASILAYICIDRKKFYHPTHSTDYILNHRAFTNTLAVITILTVDFNIFPKRYAKTKGFGFSPMDAGVGMFIFFHGTVAPEARGKENPIKRSITNSLLLIFLGITRLTVIICTSYKVPVSEYGLHWNFFITLAFLKIFSSFLLKIFSVEYIYINAMLLTIAHEILLDCGLAKFVLSDIKRTNLIEANKEGLVSLPGYLALYLNAIYFGYTIGCNESIFSKLFKCFKFTLLALTAHIIFHYYFGTSRRLANSAYCFWIIFLGCIALGLFYLAQEYFYDRQSMLAPYTFYAVNYNGLLFFLMGNIITGCINLSIDTSSVGSHSALLIIALYMFVNTLVAWILYANRVKVKI